MTKKQHLIIIWVIFILTIGSLPIWIGALFSVGQQFFSGFDDLPLFSILIGLLVGCIFSIELVIFIFTYALDQRYQVLKRTAFTVLVFELIVWGSCTLFTKYVIEAG